MTTIYQSNNTSKNPITTTEKFSKTSDKYRFTSSNDIKATLENNGFVLDGVSYASVRKEEKAGFQKHIMVFSRPDLIVDGDNKLQLLVTNSHDGASSLKLNTGVYRQVCANGLVAGDDIYSTRVLHKGGDFEKKLRESLEYIVAQIGNLKDEVNNMKKTILTQEQIQEYAFKMAQMRLADVKGLLGVNQNSVGRVRRYADQENDLYTVFNRVQESVIRGGIKYVKEVEVLNEFGEVINMEKKASTSRKVNSIDKNMKFNKELWNEAIKLVA